MKKILIIFLIFSVPFMSIAQKRSKKSKDKDQSKSYLLIKILESSTIDDLNINEFKERTINEMKDKNEIKVFKQEFLNEEKQRMIESFVNKESVVRVKLDRNGSNLKNEEIEIYDSLEQNSSSISEVINLCASFGWEIVSTNTILFNTKDKIHYVYMSR